MSDMDKGYFFVESLPLEFKPVVLDPASFNPHKKILTRYGKKLLEQGKKYYGEVKIDNQNPADGNVDGSAGRGEGDLSGCS